MAPGHTSLAPGKGWVRSPHLPGRGEGAVGGMQSWGHQGGCTHHHSVGHPGAGRGCHPQLGATAGTGEGQQQGQSQQVKALPGSCTAARVGKANPSLLSLQPHQVSSSCREFCAVLLAPTLQCDLCFSPSTDLVSQCRAAQAVAHTACQLPQGRFTLQIISSTSLEVSPGRMTVRAGWLLGRQNHEGVKYSCTQISQSGLCWWTLLRATSLSL